MAKCALFLEIFGKEAIFEKFFFWFNSSRFKYIKILESYQIYVLESHYVDKLSDVPTRRGKGFHHLVNSMETESVCAGSETKARS